MELKAPIHKAKKINSDEFIMGILLPNLKRFGGKSFIISDYTRMQDFDNAVQIDPSTLSMSFNGGVTWRTLEEVHNGLSFLDTPTILTYKDN